ncbi:uncharacterized protein LOC111356440 isoform X2 [Spodoptera litura]|uniref:Uncharacterized protein LOC111356440 isoform X2 n=1 Tax=Spodoptera litura TaxID=69820 RepID=A0A9J7IUU1_SPOLT|nr:uncharacterized protein LOC111356440 isoform X2 [Spodoptera litura]
MGVPHITSFCWCMGLEVGAKCVGFVHLLVSFILMILCSVFAENVRGFVGTAEDAGDGLYATWYKIAVATAVVTVVHVLLAFTLLFSVFKRAARGVRVWVWVMSALCAASLVCIVVLAAMHGLSGSGSDIFLSFLEGLVFFGVMAYCILCVNSYYLMLKSAEDMEGPHKSVY